MSVISWFHKKGSQEGFQETGLEDLVEHKMDAFFDQMGSVEASSVHKAVIAQVERPMIRSCLEWSGGNKLKAARVLGINRNTLSKKIKEYGIE